MIPAPTLSKHFSQIKQKTNPKPPSIEKTKRSTNPYNGAHPPLRGKVGVDVDRHISIYIYIYL